MSDFIAASLDSELAFQRKLDLEHPGLGTIEEYYNSYNNGEIPKKSAKAKKIKRAALGTYKNLLEKGDKLMLLTPDQCELLGYIELFAKLQVALQVKQVAKELIDASYHPYGYLCFKEYTTGSMYYSRSLRDDDLIILDKELFLNVNYHGYILNNIFLIPIQKAIASDESCVGFRLIDASRLSEVKNLEIKVGNNIRRSG